MSFRIEPGEKVALVGPTGSGKSTVVGLLQRFYEPTAGRILLDGQDIAGLSKRLLRSRVGTVLQRAFLFSTSIRANIAYANPGASGGEVEDAARDARILEVLDRFPDGLDTLVAKRGSPSRAGSSSASRWPERCWASPTSWSWTIPHRPSIRRRNAPSSPASSVGAAGARPSSSRTDSVRWWASTGSSCSTRGGSVADGPPDTIREQPGYFKRIADLQTEPSSAEPGPPSDGLDDPYGSRNGSQNDLP